MGDNGSELVERRNLTLCQLYKATNDSLDASRLPTNCSDLPSQFMSPHMRPYFDEISLIKTLVLSAMFVVAVVGNTATLVVMYRMRRRKSTINFLILHLAGADLFVTFFCNVTDSVWAATVQWYGGNALCKMAKFLQVFGLYLSTYITVIISVDRCLAILDPMSRNKAPRRVRLMVLAAYVISAVCSLPQTYIFRVMLGPFEEPFYQCVTFGAYTSPWQEKLYSCLSVLLMFILPLLVMVTAYMLIVVTIASKSHDLKREAAAAHTERLTRCPARDQLFRRAKVKSLCMTALFVAAFIVCWTPYYVIFVLHTFSEPETIVNQKAALSIFCFGMANSMINPMIYGAFRVCKRRTHRARPPLKYNMPPMRLQSSSSSSSKNLYKTLPCRAVAVHRY